MTKKAKTSSAFPPAHQVSASEQESMLELRGRLRTLLRERRLAQQPRLTQSALSEQLGYPYTVVTGWENDTRLFYISNVRDWAKALGYNEEEVTALLDEYGPAILPDEKAGISTGSRIETEMNERVKALRKERRLTIREFADVTGISTGHWQRIELNISNLSVAHVRQIAKVLKVNYEWLIEGRGEANSETLQQEVARLKRENEILESFRQKVLND